MPRAPRPADLLDQITELEAKAVANSVDSASGMKDNANVFDSREEVMALLKAAETSLDTETKDAPYFALFADQMGRKAAEELLGDRDGVKGIDPSGSLTVLTSGLSVVDLPSQPIYIAQLCGDGGVGRAIRRPSFEYLIQTVRTNGAAPVAPGAVKPTSVYLVAEEQAILKTIAHVSEPFEQQILENHSSLSGFVSNEMVRGVALTVDSQLINGDGTGQYLNGVLFTSGTQAQAFATDVPTTLQGTHQAGEHRQVTAPAGRGDAPR